MRARPQIRDILVAQKLKHWSLVAKFPFVDRNCSTARARRNYWRLFAKHPGRSQTWNDDRVGLHLGTGASHLNRHYCQMRAIGDGIRCKQQPPQDDCCGRPAHNFILIFGARQWLCARRYDQHLSAKGVLPCGAKIRMRRGVRVALEP